MVSVVKLSVQTQLKAAAGAPCDKYGNNLAPDTPPPPCHEGKSPGDWTPYRNRTEYELADFLFRKTQMSATNIDELMDLWASTSLDHGDCPPFADHNDLYNTIDSTPLGDAPWQSFSTTYNGEKPTDDVPPWMNAEYNVWHRDLLTVVRNLLNNSDFDGEFDYAPYRETGPNGEQHFQDYFSGDWVWEQSVRCPTLFSIQSHQSGSLRTRLLKIQQHMARHSSRSFLEATRQLCQ